MSKYSAQGVSLKKALLAGTISLACLCGLACADLGSFGIQEAQASSTKAKIKTKQEQASQVRRQLEDLGAQADEANDAIYELEQQLAETEQHIKEIVEQQLQTQEELNDTQKRLGTRVAANYMAGQSSLLSVLMGAESFDDFVSRVQYIQAISDSEAQMIQRAKELKKQLEELNTALNQRKAEEESLIDENKQKAAELELYMQEAQKILNSIDAELQALIEQQRKEEEARAQAAYQARLQAAKNKVNRAQNSYQQAQEAQRKAEAEAKADPNNKEKQKAAQAAAEATKKAKAAITTATNEHQGIVDVARTYIGTPYAGVSGGLDCSGLVSAVYKQKGVNLPRSSAAQWAAAQSEGWSVDLNSLSPGDLVFYRKKGSNRVGHVAIYAGNGKVVQAYHPGRNADEGSMNMSNWDIVGAGRPSK